MFLCFSFLSLFSFYIRFLCIGGGSKKSSQKVGSVFQSSKRGMDGIKFTVTHFLHNKFGEGEEGLFELTELEIGTCLLNT